jgi:hypothetical protein
MKPNQKITRLHLNINQEEEFSLLGIVSAEADYKLSLTINRIFRISLSNISPVRITEESGSEIIFTRFSDVSGSPEIVYTLVSNRSGKNFLLKKLKNIDYVFLVHNSEYETDIDSICSSLREIETINGVFNVDLKTLKDKNLQYLTG